MRKDENRMDYLQKMQLIAHKEVLSFREALVYLDVSESFLYKLTSKRAIEFAKPNGGKLYFKKSDLDDWMLQNASKSARVLEEELLNSLKTRENECSTIY